MGSCLLEEQESHFPDSNKNLQEQCWEPTWLRSTPFSTIHHTALTIKSEMPFFFFFLQAGKAPWVALRSPEEKPLVLAESDPSTPAPRSASVSLRGFLSPGRLRGTEKGHLSSAVRLEEVAQSRNIYITEIHIYYHASGSTRMSPNPDWCKWPRFAVHKILPS